MQYSTTADSQEPWVIPDGSLHPNADSIVDYSSRLLRFKLEQNIASLVQSRLGPEVSAAASSAAHGKPKYIDQLENHWWKEEGLPDKMADKSGTFLLQNFFEESGLEEPEPAPPGSDSVHGEPDQFLGLEHSEDGDGEEAPRSKMIDPEMQALREKAENGGGLSGCTTIMMRHVPFKYTQRKLVREINTTGFLGKYDFFYLPMDPRSHANRGFAFVNFVSPQVADHFYNTFHGKRLRHFGVDSKEVIVLPADLQGFEQNAMRYAVTQMLRGKRTGHTKPIFLRPIPLKCQPQAFEANASECEKQSRAEIAAEQVAAEQRRVAAASKEIQQRRAEAWGYVTAMSAARRHQEEQFTTEPKATPPWPAGNSQHFEPQDVDSELLANVIKCASAAAPQQAQQDLDPLTLANIIRCNTTSLPQRTQQVKPREPPTVPSTYKINFCKYCGNARTASHVFCPYCGSRIV